MVVECRMYKNNIIPFYDSYYTHSMIEPKYILSAGLYLDNVGFS